LQPAIRNCPSVKLVAIYSRSLKSAQSLNAENASLYSDDSGSGRGLDDLLRLEEVEAVIIAYVPLLSCTEELILNIETVYLS